MSSPVDRDYLRELCRRVVHGDAAALNTLAECLLPLLTRRLRRSYNRASVDLVADACEDALLEYGSRPHRFDPARGVPIESFLQLAASRNLANRLEADSRRRVREAAYASLQPLQTEATLAVADDVDGGTREKVLALENEGAERAALTAWLEGERRTAPLAAVLGLAHLSPSDQRLEVKRFKDRFRKKLQRATHAARTAK